MKKAELVLREILFQAIEKNNRTLTQASLARRLYVSLSTVNSIVKALSNMGAVEIMPKNFRTMDIKKILFFWASKRNINKDIIFATRVDAPVREIEKAMPDNIVFTAYTAYKLIFNDVPADYSEVYVYGDESLKVRFPKKSGIPNLFVLKKDKFIATYGKTTTIANTFVDLWNLREWYAKEFVKALEERLRGILE